MTANEVLFQRPTWSFPAAVENQITSENAHPAADAHPVRRREWSVTSNGDDMSSQRHFRHSGYLATRRCNEATSSGTGPPGIFLEQKEVNDRLKEVIETEFRGSRAFTRRCTK